jgi:hypothetical protein
VSQKIDLTEMERKAYMAYHQDGLWDITLGLCLLAFGIAILFDKGAFAGITPAIVIPLVLSFKERVTIPRLWHARFLPERRAVEQSKKARLSIMIGLVALILVGTIVAITLPSPLDAWLSDNVEVSFGVLMAVMLAIIALISGITRLLAYAGLILALLVAGVAVLMQFLRKYQAPSNQDYSVSS